MVERLGVRAKDPGMRTGVRLWILEGAEIWGLGGWEGSCLHGGSAGFPAPRKATGIKFSLPLKLVSAGLCQTPAGTSTRESRAVSSIPLGGASDQGTTAADTGASLAQQMRDLQIALSIYTYIRNK